jgi:hypothetical protein
MNVKLLMRSFNNSHKDIELIKKQLSSILDAPQEVNFLAPQIPRPIDLNKHVVVSDDDEREGAIDFANDPKYLKQVIESSSEHQVPEGERNLKTPIINPDLNPAVKLPKPKENVLPKPKEVDFTDVTSIPKYSVSQQIYQPDKTVASFAKIVISDTEGNVIAETKTDLTGKWTAILPKGRFVVLAQRFVPSQQAQATYKSEFVVSGAAMLELGNLQVEQQKPEKPKRGKK